MVMSDGHEIILRAFGLCPNLTLYTTKTLAVLGDTVMHLKGNNFIKCTICLSALRCYLLQKC